MKFHPILAVLPIVIMNINFAVAIWHGERVPARSQMYNWVVKIKGVSKTSDSSCGESPDSAATHCNHCTGSIISTWHILTAAHCFEDVLAGDVTVIAGTVCAKDDCRSEHGVKKIHIHPNYRFRNFSFPLSAPFQPSYKINDVAVLTLETKLVYGDKIGSIPLPTGKSYLRPHQRLCRVAGWGYDSKDQFTDYLLSTSIVVEPHSQNRHRDCQILQFICGRNPDNVTLLRKGDSGAGLVCNGAVDGIAVRAPEHIDHRPTIFEAVFDALPFIRGVFAEDAALPMNVCRRRSTCICM